MSGLERLREWLRSVFGGAGEESGAPTPPEGGFECAICGTEVPAADDTCPLCGSADVVAAAEREAETADPAPAAERRTTDDAAAERLRDVREQHGRADSDETRQGGSPTDASDATDQDRGDPDLSNH